jgi:CDP-2,3-bis-(O-geranylgeranyl)-sn-glycerol synthase
VTDSLSEALFLIWAFMLAGVAQVAWLASPWSRSLALPIDGGRTFRGKRVFGENKTLRGFVIMVPAAALTFPLVAYSLSFGAPGAAGLWPLTLSGYAALGAWAGLGFMLGELPNSFIKRQLGIPPGEASTNRRTWRGQLIADRLDSGIGMLAAVSVAVPTSWRTWAIVLITGPVLHWLFSVVMFHAGAKARPA